MTAHTDVCFVDDKQKPSFRASVRLPLARVPRSHGADGFDDQSLQHFWIHISEFLDVEAALAGRVRAHLCEQRPKLAELGHTIQNSGGLSRRKTDKWHIALAPAVVLIVVA